MTAEETKISTKEKIMEVASDLFAKNGFGGTSIRDIAKLADVNLAAINYHFKNKENLYLSIFDNNYDWIKSGVVSLGEKTKNTNELAVEVFRFFMASGSAIMNTFKIFLSDNVDMVVGESQMDQQERFGPPGQEIFFKKIRQDVGPKVSDEGCHWAVGMIFSELVHYGVVMNTTIMKERCKTHSELKPEHIENSIFHSVSAHIEYLKNHPKAFKALK